MTTQMNTKVRLVRCPKCRRVLPELVEVPIYKCGGCGIILKAKNRKSNTQDTGSRVHEADVSEDKKETIPSTDESDLDKIHEKSENGNQSNELPCLDAISCHENAGSSPEATEHTDVAEDKCLQDHNESRDDDIENPADINLSSEISSSSKFNCRENELSLPGSAMRENESFLSSPRKVDESQCSSENNSGGGQNESLNSNHEWPIINASFSKEVSSSDEFTPTHKIEDLPVLPGAHRDGDESLKSQSLSRSPTGIIPGFHRVSSADTLENMPRVYSKTDLGVTLRSPTARNYYADDGSVSSCNETEDQAPNRHFPLFKRNHKDTGSNNTKVLPKRDESMVNHYATKGSKGHQDEFVEPTKRSHPVRRMMIPETDEYVSRSPLSSKGSHAAYENGSSSNYGEFFLPEKPDYPESDKAELLRMVYELQDQLNRTQVSKGMPHRRFSIKKEDQISSHNNLFASKREKHPDLYYPRYPGRYNEDRVPRMAFSGGPTHHRDRVDCSCLRCRHQDWHYSEQLLPRVVCCNNGHSMIHTRHDNYCSHHSASSSPQHFMASEFSLWSRDKLDDQWHNNREVQKKHRPAKRHFRPIAGGAPIIACYCCSEMLQLPADFLFFKRKCHKLRCGACSEGLKFSLENGSHIVQYSADPITPPPSEVDDYTSLIRKRNLTSASRATEPVSYSEDYTQSFGRSYSTEVEHFSIAPPFETKKEGRKKSIMEDYGSRYDTAGPSSKMSKLNSSSTEIEEVPPTSGSPLHRLMGYSSPSYLVYE